MSRSDYDYRLPKDLIAQSQAEPRHSSRLLAYKAETDEISLGVFSDVARHIPSGSVLVLNDTKVVPARLELKRPTGGAVRILFPFNEWNDGSTIKGLPDKGLDMGERLFMDKKPVIEAVSHKNEEFTFKLLVPPPEFKDLADTNGRTPLPPYIYSDMKEEELRKRYQTEFADKPASVAAPTASLHFTDEVFRSLDEKGIERAAVTLHVGRGTFSPVTEDMESKGALHPEPICVSKQSADIIAKAKKEGRPVIAAGTTAMRLLESAADEILNGKIPESGYHAETTLFIRPPYDFKLVGGFITNFHLPNTSLLMLLDAFLQSKKAKKSWRELYDLAVREKFRFYSFGDAMLVI